jgi:hypothetical protein
MCGILPSLEGKGEASKGSLKEWLRGPDENGLFY